MEDGIGTDRRRARFSRLDRDLKRILVRGHAGTITLEAIRWLHGVGVPLVHLDADGPVLLVAARAAPAHPHLRRGQGTALVDGRALAIGQRLIRDKIEGQHSVVSLLSPPRETLAYLAGAHEAIPLCKTLPQLRALEADAARAYWSAWGSVTVRLQDRDELRRPRHWRRFGSRASPLLHGTTPRRAVNPANAILNYLYAILEAEARVAALAVGLDPYLGFVHTDQPSRDSLALDVMEPVRPVVDRWVLQFLGDRTFTKEDFFELHDGGCRLMPLLASQLAETAAMWARQVLPVAQGVARALQAKDGQTTPRSARRSQRIYVREFRAPSGSGEDYRKAPAALAKRRQTMLVVKAANDRWLRDHPGDYSAQQFRREILPRLQGVHLVQIMAATGLTNGMASLLPPGRTVPHPRHWAALSRLG